MSLGEPVRRALETFSIGSFQRSPRYRDVSGAILARARNVGWRIYNRARDGQLKGPLHPPNEHDSAWALLVALAQKRGELRPRLGGYCFSG
jgi:hypothetical protein